MCGRFYCDSTKLPLQKVAAVAENPEKADRLTWGEIRPSDTVTIIISKGNKAHAVFAGWGYLNDRRQISLTHARCETAENIRSLAVDLRYRRCIIPASGYLESTDAPQRLFFFDESGRQLMMAGLWRMDASGDYRFVLLTSDLCPYGEGIHPRAPLLLSEEDARAWLFDAEKTTQILSLPPQTLSYISMPARARI